MPCIDKDNRIVIQVQRPECCEWAGDSWGIGGTMIDSEDLDDVFDDITTREPDPKKKEIIKQIYDDLLSRMIDTDAEWKRRHGQYIKPAEWEEIKNELYPNVSKP